ncbi:MAG: alpha/beta fold hydrolase [Acetobacteraceae bacterium]|nr:alpha/beta fold hydrolase [Acetobacteraceae bacterium]
MRLNHVETGSGPPVVLLHGLFGAARNFGAVQRALAPVFRVIALDARNHGASPHAAGMRYETLAADVLETLDAIDVPHAAVIGHSMGGKTAMRAAVMAPERFDRLLVADIAPVPYQHGNNGVAAAMRAIPLDAALSRAAAEAALMDAVATPATRAFLVQNIQFGPSPHWRIGLDEIAAAIPDLEGWETPPGTYDGPVLFVSGARSDHVLPEHRPAIRALFPATRFVTVKNAGHWLHADNPAGFLSVVEAFLRDWKG